MAAAISLMARRLRRCSITTKQELCGGHWRLDDESACEMLQINAEREARLTLSSKGAWL
jgi:hypothetical protein